MLNCFFRVQELFKSLGKIIQYDGIPPSIVDIWSAGCKIKKPTDRELSNAGLGQSLKETKFAVLTAPLEFAKGSRKKARR